MTSFVNNEMSTDHDSIITCPKASLLTTHNELGGSKKPVQEQHEDSPPSQEASGSSGADLQPPASDAEYRTQRLHNELC